MNIENRSKKPFVIFVEPWGIDFWIKPGETFQVRAIDVIGDLDYHCVYHSDEEVAIYISGANDFAVLQDGVVLDHGHQSPER